MKIFPVIGDLTSIFSYDKIVSVRNERRKCSMFFVGLVVILLILVMVVSCIFTLDVTYPLKDRVFYFLVVLVVITILMYVFNAMGFVNLW